VPENPAHWLLGRRFDLVIRLAFWQQLAHSTAPHCSTRLGEPLLRAQRKFLLPPENSLNSGHREIAGRRRHNLGNVAGNFHAISTFGHGHQGGNDVAGAIWHLQEQHFQAE